MRQYLATVLVVWTAACIAAYLYSKQQNIPASIAIAVLPAFLAELAFYIAPAFERVRKTFERIGSKLTRAALLVASAAIPYLLLSFETHTFALRPFAVLLLATAIAAFWYTRKQRSIASDLLFLVVIGAVYLSKVFGQIYVRPAPHVTVDILGRLMWIRLGIMAVLSIRGWDAARFGFLPSRGDWRIGIEYYLYFLGVGGAVAYLVKFAHFRPLPVVWWQFPLVIVATFLGFLWVVALFEEFFFRGFLQQLIARSVHSEAAGLLAASIVFGLAHLPFGSFPNWKFALVGGISGVFYGLAFQKARSIRASMVTHALAVTTWRVLFTG